MNNSRSWDYDESRQINLGPNTPTQTVLKVGFEWKGVVDASRWEEVPAGRGLGNVVLDARCAAIPHVRNFT